MKPWEPPKPTDVIDLWNKADELKSNVESIVRTMGGVSHGK